MLHDDTKVTLQRFDGDVLPKTRWNLEQTHAKRRLPINFHAIIERWVPTHYMIFKYKIYYLNLNQTTVEHCDTKFKLDKVHSRVTDSSKLSRDPHVKVNFVIRPLRKESAQKTCRCEHGEERLIISHRNSFPLFVKHLTISVLTWKYLLRQQYW